jgi:hypothetical protein
VHLRSGIWRLKLARVSQTNRVMKLLGAGLFVVGGMFGLVVLLDTVNVLTWLPVWAVGGFMGLALLGLGVVALGLFGQKPPDTPEITPEEHRRQLEAQGLVEPTDFRATRSFGVEEFEDEGLHYYLELKDGSVLFLSGQYLYDYEPDPKLNRPRSFPCTEFTVRRHKRDGYAVGIDCRGEVLEPELMAPPFRTMDWEHQVPRDGEILTDPSYDTLKNNRLGVQ